ncbi:MAG: glutaredoxin [Proteobacteria bacterium]|nr:glutaredoxin [Pseudomonadota bacterium]
MPRSILAPEAYSPAAIAAVQAFHAEIIKSITQTLAQEKLVVIGMSGNPFVKKIRKALDQAGIQYKYLEYGSYFSQWKQRLAIKLWSGWPTYPQVFLRGVLLGGATEALAALADGSLQKRLQSVG